MKKTFLFLCLMVINSFSAAASGPLQIVEVFGTPTQSENEPFTGTLSVVINGGTPPYTTSITIPPSTSPVDTKTNSATTVTFTELIDALYLITVTDLHGNRITANYEIGLVNQLLMIDLRLVNGIQCAGESDGALEATARAATDFTGNLTFTLTATQPVVIPAGIQTQKVVAVTPGSDTRATFGVIPPDTSGLPAGRYTVTVTDTIESAAQEASLIIVQPVALACSTTTTPFDVTTNTGGTITVNANGGSGQFLFSLNGGTPQTSNEFKNVARGTYTVTVSDGIGCSTTCQAIVGCTISPSGNDIQDFLLHLCNPNC